MRRSAASMISRTNSTRTTARSKQWHGSVLRQMCIRDSCCGPEVVALFAGQAAKLSPKQKERAFQEVRWGKRPENIPVLEQAGITVDKFGGEAFRAAVSDGEAKLAKLLLEKGADINYHKPDMVFPLSLIHI